MSPFADCSADFPGSQPGFVFIGSEVEPWVGVNPVDPLNVVGTWQQDRWSNGGARGLVAGVSFDGGVTWESVVVPGLTRCSGGRFWRASDPWLSFGPDGTLHHIALVFDIGQAAWNGMAASRSTDGGLTWSQPVLLAQSREPLFHDKESLTADPADANLVYAVWDRLDYVQDRGPVIFARSTDGGASWEPIRAIHDPGPHNQTVGNQLIVLPDGTLIDFFTEIISPNPWTHHVYLASKSSGDKGSTWEPATGSTRIHPILPVSSVAPQTGTDVRDGAYLFDVAVDPRNGALYLVWQEGGLRPVPFPVVAFSMSRDGGETWSSPVAVNRTATDPPSPRGQAFTPSVHVAGDGTVGISFYDFRNDGTEPASLTDHWLIRCHPEAADCTNPERWRDEVRLTDDSFDIHLAPYANGLFLGDYVGLAADDREFIALFTQPHEGDASSVFARRIRFEEILEPRSPGFWKHQVRAALDGRGRAEVPPEALLEHLADIQAIHGLFDGVEGLEGLRDVLDPPAPTDPRARGRKHLIALLLNLVSSRLSPSVEVREGEAVVDAAAWIVTVLEDPAAGRRDLEAAKDLAEAINEGALPLVP